VKTTFLEKLTSKRTRLKRLKDKIIVYFSGLSQDTIPEDQKVVIGYLKQHDIAIFPYAFPQKYRASDIELFTDEKLNLYYTLWDGKKLYYKNGSRRARAQEYFNSLRLEQDEESPHRYLTHDFDVSENDIVVDIGAAEGNFSLSIIEKAKFVYLFEADKDWIEALRATFAPWQNKVKIIQKFVSDSTTGNMITLDDFFTAGQTIDFIKADVEGAEGDVIRGASKVIERQPNVKIAVCTYHRQEDADNLDAMLRSKGFTNKFSPGYMLYYYGKTNIVRAPFLRKAVLRAIKG